LLIDVYQVGMKLPQIGKTGYPYTPLYLYIHDKLSSWTIYGWSDISNRKE